MLALYCRCHHECIELWGCPEPPGDTLGPVGTCQLPSSPVPGAQELSQPCASSTVQVEMLSHSTELGGLSP